MDVTMVTIHKQSRRGVMRVMRHIEYSSTADARAEFTHRWLCTVTMPRICTSPGEESTSCNWNRASGSAHMSQAVSGTASQRNL